MEKDRRAYLKLRNISVVRLVYNDRVRDIIPIANDSSQIALFYSKNSTNAEPINLSIKGMRPYKTHHSNP